MTKSKSLLKQMDVTLAEELGLLLSPFSLTLDHVCKLDSKYGGFHFGFLVDGQIWYDSAELKSIHLGCRVKPSRFLLPDMVAHRLHQRVYKRWYFQDRTYLYPVQPTKVDTLFEKCWFIENDIPHYTTSVIVNIEQFNLRKKPLINVRKQYLTWDDSTILPSHTPTHTQPVTCECYA
jgi:hypothetical protein